jgi:hypothetical protein
MIICIMIASRIFNCHQHFTQNSNLKQFSEGMVVIYEVNVKEQKMKSKQKGDLKTDEPAKFYAVIDKLLQTSITY